MKKVMIPFFLACICLARHPFDSQAGEEKRVPKRNVTFIVTSDCHYDAFENEDRNERNRETIREMNAIEDLCWPAEHGGKPIDRPRGVIILGDVIDDGDRVLKGNHQTPRQWAEFASDFGLDGTDGLLRYPVFEGWGNHDGPPEGKERFGFSFQGELKKRNRLRKEKGSISNLSEGGLHYSWDWDDVHFVQLNFYPADQQHKEIKYSPIWHDPQGSLDFLKKDLAKSVKATWRPVVLLSHCGFDTDWWHPEDWKAVYEAVKPYNVILYFHGHTGTGLREWAPEGERRPLSCVNTGQTENGFFLVHIGGDQVHLVYRVKEGNKITRNPDGSYHREWDGKWSWRWIQKTKIESGPASGALPLRRRRF